MDDSIVTYLMQFQQTVFTRKLNNKVLISLKQTASGMEFLIVNTPKNQAR